MLSGPENPEVMKKDAVSFKYRYRVLHRLAVSDYAKATHCRLFFDLPLATMIAFAVDKYSFLHHQDCLERLDKKEESPTLMDKAADRLDGDKVTGDFHYVRFPSGVDIIRIRFGLVLRINAQICYSDQTNLVGCVALYFSSIFAKFETSGKSRKALIGYSNPAA